MPASGKCCGQRARVAGLDRGVLVWPVRVTEPRCRHPQAREEKSTPRPPAARARHRAPHPSLAENTSLPQPRTRQLATVTHPPSTAAPRHRAASQVMPGLDAGCWPCVWTAIRMCPVTVTKSMPWPSQRVIGLAGRRAARSAPCRLFACVGLCKFFGCPHADHPVMACVAVKLAGPAYRSRWALSRETARRNRPEGQPGHLLGTTRKLPGPGATQLCCGLLSPR